MLNITLLHARKTTLVPRTLYGTGQVSGMIDIHAVAISNEERSFQTGPPILVALTSFSAKA